jgi:hypothetical protein
MASVDMCEHEWPGTGCKQCFPPKQTTVPVINGKAVDLSVTKTTYEGRSRRLPYLNDPKYIIADNRLVNRFTGAPIPDDEPVFIVRGKDIFAAEMLLHYAKTVDDGKHQGAILGRLSDFLEFARKHPERMQRPDTTLVGDGSIKSVLASMPRPAGEVAEFD